MFERALGRLLNKKPPIEMGGLEGANLTYDLCANVEKFLTSAIEHDDAYVINGVLVMKFTRTRETSKFKFPHTDTSPQDKDYYGLVRAALCVKDSPPFKRGQWYLTRSPEVRLKILEDSENGNRSITLPIKNEDWKVITHTVPELSVKKLLPRATAYAEKVGGVKEEKT